MVTLAISTETYELSGDVLEAARVAVYSNALRQAAEAVASNDPDHPTYNPGHFEWLLHVVAAVETLGAPDDPLEPVSLDGLTLIITRRAALEAAAATWDRDDAKREDLVLAQRLLVALGWPEAA